MSVLDAGSKVSIGCGDEARIRLDGSGASQALELPLLQNAKQLRLKFQRNLTDLIQKGRPTIGQFKPSEPLHDGAGECAFFVTEKFAF
jgi:hypothetical protein